MSATLWLGPLALSGFELPDGILWGGRQRLALHRLPGGARVIDAMGRDDAPISWQGVFTGPEAANRARMVDLVRAEGIAWPLAWDGFFYTVIVSEFRAEYSAANWIPYRIACTVLRDEAEAVVEIGLDLAADALADLSAAAGLAGLDLASPVAALGVPAAASVGSAANLAAIAALAAANRDFDGSFAAADAAAPADPWGDDAADASGRLAALAGARGYLRRAQGGLEG